MDCHASLAMTGVRLLDCHASLAMTGVRSLDCHASFAMTGGGMWIALVALVVCNRGIGEGNQIFYLFILQERNGEAKMVCDMARNENGGLLRMEGSGGIGSGGQRCKI